jgi:hypothetical protein
MRSTTDAMRPLKPYSWVPVSLSLVLSNCAMSPLAYSVLYSSVEQVNETELEKARSQLESNGYRFINEEILVAELPWLAQENCDAASFPQLNQPLDPTQVMRLTVSGFSKDLPPQVTLLAKEACPFFAGQVATLDLTRTDGTPAHFAKIPSQLLLARNPQGERVLIETVFRTRSRRKVLVRQSCDHMPGIGERGPSHLVLEPAPTQVIKMQVDRDEVDRVCTQNTY